MNRFFVILTLILSVSLAMADEPATLAPEPLSFNTWKQQQVLEAQNQLLRAQSDRNSADPEKELLRAQDRLEAAKSLQLEEYVSIYLSTLASQPEMLDKLAEKLSKEELAVLLKQLLSKTPQAANNTSRQIMGRGVALSKIRANSP